MGDEIDAGLAPYNSLPGAGYLQTQRVDRAQAGYNYAVAAGARFIYRS